MEIFIIWLIFAIVVGVAASSRGRSGFGWFVLAVIISPLIAILLLLAMPNLKHADLLQQLARNSRPPATPAVTDRLDRVQIETHARPFEADGVYAGIPYKVATDSTIEAIMQGARVSFRDFDKFTGALGRAG